MDSVCGRESPVSPPTVVAPLAIKPAPLGEAHAHAGVTAEQQQQQQQQQRLLYQLALAERLRLASAGLAWARPPFVGHNHHYFQEVGASFMGLPTMMVGGGGGGGGGQQVVVPPPPPPPPNPFYGYHRLLDPRLMLPRGPEEPKPQHSYIGLIALAILSSPDKKLVLSDIYQYILDHYPYFRSRGPGWRNSIRHNLSLNDCFVKAGRSANGKGHYWAIHPANVDDFRRGDFRRRRAQRRVRKHLGLAVDDDSSPEPPSPAAAAAAHDTPTAAHHHHHHQQHHHHQHTTLTAASDDCPQPQPQPRPQGSPGLQPQPPAAARKRQFDVASLLAPDDKLAKTRRQGNSAHDPAAHEIDVVSDDSRPAHRHHVSPSPTPAAPHDDEEDDDDDEDDDPRPWSLLGWVSGAPWPLAAPAPTPTDDRETREPPPAP